MHKQKNHTNELDQKVNKTMALLDLDAPVPEGLSPSIMARIDELEIPKVRKLNFTSYIQIAAAILFGVFIGHKFGQGANTQTRQAMQIKKDPINQYFDAHHFNIDNTDFKNPTIY